MYRQYWRAFVYSLVTIMVSPSFGQANKVGAATTAKAFEESIFARLNARRPADEPRGCSEVLSKFQGGIRVSERLLSRCVEETVAFEGLQTGTQGSVKARLVGSIAYLDDIILQLDDESPFRSVLLQRRAELLLQSSSDNAEIIAAIKTALVPVDAIRLAFDIRRNRLLLALGNQYKGALQPELAESCYLSILAYTWYTIEGHVEELQALRSIYVAAGKGLIELRQNDMAKLQSIVFVPATLVDLGPILEQAKAHLRR